MAMGAAIALVDGLLSIHRTLEPMMSFGSPLNAELYSQMFPSRREVSEQKYDARLQAIADDDGMPPPYIKLKGINERRMLSWAEERALREDLLQHYDAVRSASVDRPVYRYPLADDWISFYGSSGQ